MVAEASATDQGSALRYAGESMGSGEAAAVAWRVGDVVAGKYRVDRVLGAGGMGVVVAATQLDLDRKVAIKFLLPSALQSADVVARFSREARAAAKIQSEHVARVIDVGTLDGARGGAPYMVMEYLEGTDLAQRVAAGGGLPVAEAVRYVLEACEALAEAHAAGIVHRDLKPANLFLARRPDRTSSIKVLDFGISKAPVGDAARDGGITSTQAVMGSPLYMSPEQLVSAKKVDHRSDIWSLGVVLFEALTGATPFDAESMPEIVAQILTVPAPSVRSVRPELPAEIDAVVARCLAKDPGARFRDVAELARALAPLSPESSRSVERVSRVLGEPAPDEASASASARSDTGWGATRAAGVPRRSPVAWIAVGVLGVGAAVVAVAVVAMRGSRAGDGVPAVAASITEATASAAAPSALPSADLAPPVETVVGADADAGADAGARADTGAGKPRGHAGKAAPATTRAAVAGNEPAPPATKPASPAPTPPPAPTPTNALDMPFK